MIDKYSVVDHGHLAKISNKCKNRIWLQENFGALLKIDEIGKFLDMIWKDSMNSGAE